MEEPPEPKALVEFRAGLLKLDGTMMVPDSRKGLFRLTIGDEGLTHVQWYERTDAGPVILPEIDVIVLPDEATFTKIPIPSQRVLALKFPQEKDRNLFFWMQEPDPENDGVLRDAVQAVLDGLVGEPNMDTEMLVADRAATERGAPSGAPGAGTEVLQGPTGGVVPSGPAEYPIDTAATPVDLASILSTALAAGMHQAAASKRLGGSGVPNSDQLAASLLAGLAAAHATHTEGPHLDEVLHPEVMLPLLQEPQVAARLASYLPEAHRAQPEQLLAVAHSPPFHQQLQAFSRALHAGQVDLGQFGLDAKGFSVVDFLSAIQELVDKEGGGQQGGASSNPSGASGSDTGAAMQE